MQKSKNQVVINGQWTIHGVSKPAKIETTLDETDSEIIKLQTNLKFNLKDFGVVVKKAFVISVNDDIDVKLNLNLKKRR